MPVREENRKRDRRRGLALQPGNVDRPDLERRLLAAYFYQAPGAPSGDIAMNAQSEVSPDPAIERFIVERNTGGPVGGVDSSSFTNALVTTQDEGGGITTHFYAQESGIMSSTLEAPIDQTTGLAGVQLVVAHSHIDSVTADGDGPYALNGAIVGQTTSSATTAPLNYVAANSPITVPPTGNVTVNFTVDISALDASGPNGEARFNRTAGLTIASTYETIQISPQVQGVYITNPVDGSLIAQDPYFSNLGQGDTLPSYHFSWSQRFPVVPALVIAYNDTFVSSPLDGATFNYETASLNQTFSWAFSVAGG